MSKLIIIDDQKTPLRHLLAAAKRQGTPFRDIGGWLTNSTFDLEGTKQLTNKEKIVNELNSLRDGDTTVFSDLVWDGIQSAAEWQEEENCVRIAVVEFLKRNKTNRFVIYTSLAPGPKIACDIATQSNTKGQSICLAQLNASPNTDDNATELISSLQSKFGVYRCQMLNDLWEKNGNGQLFTYATPCVPHTFNANADHAEIQIYLKTLTESFGLNAIGQIPEQYHCESFHESAKSLIGGVAIMNGGSGLPLTLGGVLGLVFLAVTKVRNAYPEWDLAKNPKTLLNRPFVKKQNGLSNMHENRQCASLLYNAFNEWFVFEKGKSAEVNKLKFGTMDKGFKVGLEWLTPQDHKSLTSKAGDLFSTSTSFQNIQNSACAYVYVNQWLEGHPGKVAIEKSVLSITAESDG